MFSNSVVSALVPSIHSHSNYTIRTMPLPLYDIGRAGKDPSIEQAVQKLQVFLCRNHSDERLKVELAARHRHRLLTATQQSVRGGGRGELWGSVN